MKDIPPVEMLKEIVLTEFLVYHPRYIIKIQPSSKIWRLMDGMGI